MKAIDYFNKYRLTIVDNKELTKLVQEMSEEVKELAKKRNTNSDSSVVSIIKEINQKWNKLCGLYEKEYGKSILIRNGFLIYWEAKIPNLTK